MESKNNEAESSNPEPDEYQLPEENQDNEKGTSSSNPTTHTTKFDPLNRLSKNIPIVPGDENVSSSCIKAQISESSPIPISVDAENNPSICPPNISPHSISDLQNTTVNSCNTLPEILNNANISPIPEEEHTNIMETSSTESQTHATIPDTHNTLKIKSNSPNTIDNTVDNPSCIPDPMPSKQEYQANTFEPTTNIAPETSFSNITSECEDTPSNIINTSDISYKISNETKLEESLPVPILKEESTHNENTPITDSSVPSSPMNITATEITETINTTLINTNVNTATSDSSNPPAIHSIPFDINNRLLSAALNGNVDSVLELLKMGADINSSDPHSALHYAVVHNHIDVGKVLLESGIIVDISDGDSTPFIWACLFNKREFASLLIQHGADIHTRNKHEKTILHLLVENKRNVCVPLLVQAGADVNAKDKYGCTPLHYAAARGSTSCVRFLLDSGANVDALDNMKRAPIHFAARLGNEPNVRLLSNIGIDLSSQDQAGRSPLHLSVQYERDHKLAREKDRSTRNNTRSHINCTRHLLKSGANVSVTDNMGRTPLHWAAVASTAKTIRLLLENSADISAKDREGFTPLHLVTRRGHEYIAFNYNEQDEYYSPDRKENEFSQLKKYFRQKIAINLFLKLWKSMIWGQKSCLRQLLESGADISAKDQFERTALHWAAIASTDECVHMLLEHGSDVLNRDKQGSTPLHFAADRLLSSRYLLRSTCINMILSNHPYLKCDGHYIHNLEWSIHMNAFHWGGPVWGHTKIIQHLLDYRGDINAKDNSGMTPLHSIVGSASLEAINMILDRGANVSIKDEAGNTPIHVASWKRQAEAVRLLIQKGAKITEANNEGRTPLHIASSEGYDNVVSVLLEVKADLSVRDNQGNTPLHNAVCKGHEDVVRLLINKGADVSVRNLEGQTPLHFPSFMNTTNIIQLLLHAGADVSATDNRGRTALHYAVVEYGDEGVRALLEEGAKVLVKDNDGKTPQDLALAEGRMENVSLLRIFSKDDNKNI